MHLPYDYYETYTIRREKGYLDVNHKARLLEDYAYKNYPQSREYLYYIYPVVRYVIEEDGKLINKKALVECIMARVKVEMGGLLPHDNAPDWNGMDLPVLPNTRVYRETMKKVERYLET